MLKELMETMDKELEETRTVYKQVREPKKRNYKKEPSRNSGVEEDI